MVKTKKEMGKLPKYVKLTTEANCPYCHKHVKSLEDHINDKHKGEKPPIK